MYLEFLNGDLVAGTISEDQPRDTISPSVPTQWARNARRITCSRSSGTSISYTNNPATSGIAERTESDEVTGTFQASFRHIDTDVETEVTSPWVWHYLRSLYSSRCSYRDIAGSTATSQEISEGTYAGADTGCPSASDFSFSLGTPSSGILNADTWNGFDNPSLGVGNPTMPFLSRLCRTDDQDIRVLLGYPDGATPAPKTNLCFVDSDAHTGGACVASGSYPDLPVSPSEGEEVFSSGTWNSRDEDSAIWSDNQLSLSFGASSSLTRVESNIYSAGLWSGWTLQFIQVSISTASTMVLDRIGFDDWTFDKQVFLDALESLGL